MTFEDIHETVTFTPFKPFIASLSNGETIAVNHPDYVFLPPAGNSIIFVKPKGGRKIVDVDHVVSLNLGGTARPN